MADKKRKNRAAGLGSDTFLRNLILALCSVVVFLFVVALLLGIFTRHNKYKQVPDFRTMDIEVARKAAKKASLRIEINDSLFVPSYDGGMVLEQNPSPGTHVKSGRRIFVTVNSYRQKMVRVPYVTGYSLRQAKNILEVAGLEIDRLVYQSDIATNNVLEQRYNGQPISSSSDLEVEIGSGITLVVGLSQEAGMQAVPKVVGFPLKEAKSRLWEAGLNVGQVDFDPDIDIMTRNDARVFLQTPDQARRVSPGAIVNIRLTLDAAKVDKGSAESDKQAKSAVKAQKDLEEMVTDVIQETMNR